MQRLHVGNKPDWCQARGRLSLPACAGPGCKRPWGLPGKRHREGRAFAEHSASPDCKRYPHPRVCLPASAVHQMLILLHLLRKLHLMVVHQGVIHYYHHGSPRLQRLDNCAGTWESCGWLHNGNGALHARAVSDNRVCCTCTVRANRKA